MPIGDIGFWQHFSWRYDAIQLWVVYINNCPRCNTKQSIYYSVSSRYMFRVSTAPIIRIIQNCNYSLGTVQLPPSNVATLEGGSCTVPEAVVTVLCAPDDGCGWNPKHVAWTCRIINRLLCVTSRWTIINPLAPELFFFNFSTPCI